MSHEKYFEVATKYRAEDMAGALIPGSRLSNILQRLELGEGAISVIAQEFLRKEGLSALLRYARNECTYDEFLIVSEPEQSERRIAEKAKSIEEQTEQDLKDAAIRARLRKTNDRLVAERIAFENDPKNIAKAEQLDLRRKYGLGYYIEKGDFPKIMNILRKVDKRERLSEKEVIWLSTEGLEYFTTELREVYHQNEADFHAGEFKKSKDPWSAVNASSHYRKCNESNTADSILNTISIFDIKNPKLKSALCTTHGGVKRDLMKYDEALRLGDQAHLLTPKDFRPCTLLGAVNIEIGNFELGQSWFRKAVERGYSEDSMDRELKNIFFRCSDKSKQDALRNNLLRLDPDRYSWAKKRLKKTVKNSLNHL